MNQVNNGQAYSDFELTSVSLVKRLTFLSLYYLGNKDHALFLCIKLTKQRKEFLINYMPYDTEE